MTTSEQTPSTAPPDPTAPAGSGGLLGRVADAVDGATTMRFGHLVPLSARQPSPVYVRSLQSPLLAEAEVEGEADPDATAGDEELDKDERAAGDGARAEAEDDVHLRSRSHRRDTLVTTVVGLGTYGLSLFTGPALARLGDSERGTYQAVWGPTQIIGWLLMIGLPAATTYYARRDNRKQLDNSAWLVTLAIGLPVYAVLWPLVPLLLHKHPPMAVFWFRAVLAAMLLVLPMQNSFEYLRARGGNTKFNVYRSLPLVLTTVFIVGAALAGSLTLSSALACTFFANLLGALVVLALERSYPRFRRSAFDWQLTKLQLHYGVRVWVGTLSNMVLARFDQILMVTIVSAAALGHYAIAVTAAGLSAPVAQGVGYALFPFLRRDADPEARNRRMWQGFRWVLLGSLAICGLLAAFMPWVIPVVFGETYRASLPAFYVLLPGQVLWNLGLVFKTRLEADNLPGKGSNALLVAAAMTLLGVPLAVPHFGIMGAAMVTVISQGVFCAACYLFIVRSRGQAVYDGAVTAAPDDDADGDGTGAGSEPRSHDQREPARAGS